MQNFDRPYLTIQITIQAKRHIVPLRPMQLQACLTLTIFPIPAHVCDVRRMKELQQLQGLATRCSAKGHRQ
jgi:hypothetical protein